MRLAMLWLAMWSAAACCSGQSFPIAGVLLDSQTGSPVKRAHVVLTGGRAGEQSVVTGEDGRFFFEAPAGKYGLMAERRGSRQSFQGDAPMNGFGSGVVTGPDQDAAHLVFRWFAPAVIFGRVIDDRGDPIENASVQVVRESVVLGRKHLAAYTTVRTDDRGNYRAGLLAGGTYYLVATAVALSSRNPARMMQVDATPSSIPPQEAYSPTYFPNVLDPRAAAPLVLNPGKDVQADFTLRTVLGATVHAVCPGSSPVIPPSLRQVADTEQGRRLQEQMRQVMEKNAAAMKDRCTGSLSFYLHGVGDVQTLQATNYIGAGQGIPGIPPGHYTLRYNGAGGSIRKDTDIHGGDLTLEFETLPAPSLTGVVTLKDPSSPPRSGLFLRLVNEETGGSINRNIGSDGSITWKNVTPGIYRPQVNGGGGFYISSMSARGVELTDGVIELVNGVNAHLQIVADNSIGRVNGFVKNGDKPVVGALVVLAPVSSSNPLAYRGYQTDLDGSFDIAGVSAGDYILFSCGRVDLEYANPAAVKPYVSRGKAVTVAARGLYTETIPLITPDPK